MADKYQGIEWPKGRTPSKRQRKQMEYLLDQTQRAVSLSERHLAEADQLKDALWTLKNHRDAVLTRELSKEELADLTPVIRRILTADWRQR